jgi:hypothetical protein
MSLEQDTCSYYRVLLELSLAIYELKLYNTSVGKCQSQVNSILLRLHLIGDVVGAMELSTDTSSFNEIYSRLKTIGEAPGRFAAQHFSHQQPHS